MLILRTPHSLLLGIAGTLAASEALPLPTAAALPEPPPLCPAIATAGGQRRLLADTDQTVAWDARRGIPVASRPGCWTVNLPFSAIGGAPADVAKRITGLPAAEVRNWWLFTPGTPGAEPAEPTGPAPIVASPGAALIVDGTNPAADDAGPGSAETPLRSLGAAVKRLAPGMVVRVKPGIYRESISVKTDGTASAPIIIEGVRDAAGRMPVISANGEIPRDSWQAEAGAPGVWRAPIPWDAFGTVSVDGRRLAERDLAGALAAGEVVVNRSSREFTLPRIAADCDPAEGDRLDGQAWTRIRCDDKGGLVLPRGDAVYYLSAWLWVEPGKRQEGEIFDPTCPRPIGADLGIGGFRFFRQTGSPTGNQINQIRLWRDGRALSCIPGPGRPSASAAWGDSGDTMKNFPMAEGWNHLLVQLDTTTRPQDLRFTLAVPKNIGTVRSSAVRPAARGQAPAGIAARETLGEALILGPFPAVRERALYLRLPQDRDPRSAVVDAARTGTVLSIDGSFVHVRGLELRHGGQFQQKPLVAVNAPGDLLEGCFVREAEWNAVCLGVEGGNQTDPPVTVRGNWMLAPGGVGVGAGVEGFAITAATVDQAPGRRRSVIEWNRIIDSSRLGQDRWWESGAIKLCKQTGAIVRQNEFLRSEGPGVWFDWENYGNRIEANRSSGVCGFLAGVEASAGPMVIGANLAIDTRPGGVWFRSAILAWSSAQVWAVNNTIDGAWNAENAYWQGQDGADGIYLDEGGDDRGTHWGRLPSRRQVILNNLITGCDAGIQGGNRSNLIAGNVADTDRRNAPVRFRDAKTGDYRLATSEGLTAGTADAPEAQQVRYDFLGLPFANGVGRAIGAFRVDQPVPATAAAVIEVETVDGRFLRIIR